MVTVKASDNQTILDLALRHYGTAEAVGEIIRNNAGLINDPGALVREGRRSGDFYPDVKLKPGLPVLVDDKSRVVSRGMLRKIDVDVTTYA